LTVSDAEVTKVEGIYLELEEEDGWGVEVDRQIDQQRVSDRLLSGQEVDAIQGEWTTAEVVVHRQHIEILSRETIIIVAWPYPNEIVTATAHTDKRTSTAHVLIHHELIVKLRFKDVRRDALDQYLSSAVRTAGDVELVIEMVFGG
jgi:hypothetical protein